MHTESTGVRLYERRGRDRARLPGGAAQLKTISRLQAACPQGGQPGLHRGLAHNVKTLARTLAETDPAHAWAPGRYLVFNGRGALHHQVQLEK